MSFLSLVAPSLHRIFEPEGRALSRPVRNINRLQMVGRGLQIGELHGKTLTPPDTCGAQLAE